MRSWLVGVTESTCIVVSPVLGRGQLDGGESCIVLPESGPTRSNVRRLQYANFVLQASCELYCRMSWRLKCVRMIAAMYVSSADTEDLKKLSKLGVYASAGMGASPGQYRNQLTAMHLTPQVYKITDK